MGMGETLWCNKLLQLPLWYASYDNTPNFKDFKPFRGWTYPTMKKYTDTIKLYVELRDFNLIIFHDLNIK